MLRDIIFWRRCEKGMSAGARRRSAEVAIELMFDRNAYSGYRELK
jgi:hypothetical protein